MWTKQNEERRDARCFVATMAGLLVVVVLAIVTSLAGCGRKPTRGVGPTVEVDPAGLTSKTRDEILVSVAALATASGLDLAGWIITVSPYPVTLPAPEPNPFNPSETISTATSYTDLATHVMALSWRLAANGEISVEDESYELANVACGCESGLLGVKQ
jgi:Prokaryotic lipoprotein-attachment site